MALRLKKLKYNMWRIDSDRRVVMSAGGHCQIKSENAPSSPAFFVWNKKNTYQTEYRKMRSALVAFLGDEKSTTEKIDDAVLLIRTKDAHRKEIEACQQAAHEESQRAMQLENRVKELEAEVETLKNQLAIYQKKGTYLEGKVNSFLSQEVAPSTKYSNDRDMMVQNIRRQFKEMKI